MLEFKIRDINIDLVSIALWVIGILYSYSHIFASDKSDTHLILGAMFIIGAILYGKINECRREKCLKV